MFYAIFFELNLPQEDYEYMYKRRVFLRLKTTVEYNGEI